MPVNLILFLGDILKTAFPLEEFEEKFDAQKLTSIMNYPDIYKDVYAQVAQWIYGRSAQLVAASLTGLIMLLKSYNKDIRKVCLVAEGSLFWSENRKDKNYNILVMEKLREHGCSNIGFMTWFYQSLCLSMIFQM